MSDRAPIPNLPPISSIKDPDVRVALESMWNAWRVRNGDVGDGEHKFLTAADLSDALNSTNVIRGGGGTLGTGGTGSGGKGVNTTWVKPLLQTIDDYIMQSWLWKKLGEEIETIKRPEWFIDRLDRSVGTAIRNEQIIREAADSSLASSVTTVSAVLNGNIAQVTQKVDANVNTTEATAAVVTTLQAEFNDSRAQIIDSMNVLTDANQSVTKQLEQAVSIFDNNIAGISSQITTIANSVSSWVGSTTTYMAANDNMVSLVDKKAQSGVDAAGLVAKDVTTLQIAVGYQPDGTSTALAKAESSFQLSTSIDKQIRGAWTVKFDANGYVTGAGLSLEGKNGNYQSSFYVRADKFAIGNPQYPGVAPKIPFKVFSTTQNINGKSVPPGVYIDDAVIGNGTIDNAMIGHAAVDTLEIQGNAVTVPLAVSGAACYLQTDPIDVSSVTIYLNQPGWVYASFNGNQGYPEGIAATEHYIYINGQVASRIWTGDAYATSISASGAVYCNAGNVTVTVQSKKVATAGNPARTVGLTDISLFVQGAKK